MVCFDRGIDEKKDGPGGADWRKPEAILIFSSLEAMKSNDDDDDNEMDGRVQVVSIVALEMERLMKQMNEIQKWAIDADPLQWGAVGHDLTPPFVTSQKIKRTKKWLKKMGSVGLTSFKKKTARWFVFLH